ncbi:helix-turn-helix transcriptional regulator [Herbaspirillum sp. GCM10030257]|uniref:helix-turn-helix transcriptional regulator n=1 Tax=Herbaspirillum sp. GCM10030257 TaxID=3273393 RepID=UPI00361C41A5
MKAGTPFPEQLVALFYEGILEPALWKTGMEAITHMTTSESATLTVWDRPNDHGSIHESASLPEECRRQYNDHFTWVDPARSRIDGFSVGEWYIDQHHFGLRNMQRSEFYQDFMRPYGLGSVMICPLVRQGGIESFLSLERSLQKLPYDQTDAALLMAVIPHLQRAIRIRSHFQSVHDQAEICSSALDCLLIPLFVVNAHGRVLLSNASAESLLRNQIILKSNGALLDVPYAPPGLFSRHIKLACGDEGAAFASGMLVTNPKRNVTIQLLVTPLPAHNNLHSMTDQPLALVIMHDSARMKTSSQMVLQQLFLLSPAETRLTAEILRGATIHEAAEHFGVELSTVRSQLKSIFRKTGVTRQAELVRMLSTMRIFDLAV